ncbi:mycofactocin biosynthesis peptidyl-dipeptidase MftE [Jatrophihabitans sp. DSM 45814]
MATKDGATVSSVALSPLADATWPAVERSERRVLVLSVGSLEQHGPHLPLDTDAFLARTVAERVHRSRPSAGLAPTIPFGASGEHADFPGTLSIGTSVLSDTIVELVRDASRFWAATLLINGHGGNLAAIDRARSICQYEGRTFAAYHLGLRSMDGHAGRAETSMMLHLAPERVNLSALEVGNDTPVAKLMPELRVQGVRPVSPNGILGDPTDAHPAEGQQLIAALTAAALAEFDQLADRAN